MYEDKIVENGGGGRGVVDRRESHIKAQLGRAVTCDGGYRSISASDKTVRNLKGDRTGTVSPLPLQQ